MVAPVDPGDRGRHRRAGSGLTRTDAALAARSWPARRELRRARLAVLTFFGALGLANGGWLARIPAVKQNLHLSDGVLGLALLSAPLGLVVMVLFASRVVHRFGSRRPTWIAGTCTAVLPIALGVAPNLATLMIALFFFGLAGGMMDVAMNSQAVLVERRAGRPLMTSFHACFSFGALAGALLGGLFAWAAIVPAINFATVGVPLALVVALAGRWLVADSGGNEVDPATAARPAAAAPPAPNATVSGLLRSWTPAMLLMALLSLCSLLGEGSADGWSAVYLRDNLGTSAALATLAYAGFSVAMALGRLSGDRLNTRFGATALMRCCGLIAAAGLGLGLASDYPAGAIVGFTAFGAGLSCTFPLLVSAAGNIDPDRPARGIARVAGAGYAGMLAGPPIIGGLASAVGLRWALLLPLALALVIAAGAGVTGAGARLVTRSRKTG